MFDNGKNKITSEELIMRKNTYAKGRPENTSCVGVLVMGYENVNK